MSNRPAPPLRKRGTLSSISPSDPYSNAVAGRVRAVIDVLRPDVDRGRFPAKHTAGQPVRVEAHCLTDGHDQLRVMLMWQQLGQPDHVIIEMADDGNDVWTAEFTPPTPGRYRFTASAWVDHFESWRTELERRNEVGDVRTALQVGAALLVDTATRAGVDEDALTRWATLLRDSAADRTGRIDLSAMKAMALDPTRGALAARYPDRRFATHMSRELVVDRQRAEFSSWYEMFPRSAAPEPGRHGTFRDVEAQLPYVAQLGFDVLYLPPIHPIGRINRKGPNNTLTAADGDVGSPWAIGSNEGGHKAILPQLGTSEDFERLVCKARELGIEIALDLAYQCAPDHPYVTAHPGWFKHRPDGTVQYAENPPKKYQDIYPFNFECDDWRGLWEELKSVVDHWIAHGVRVFRVDNPHTKSFGFWEWLITSVKEQHPDVIFLAEAFTRPKIMHRLAKLGFSQSYTYYTWRNTKSDLIEYFTELNRAPGNAYFRPNVWPNTPDILHESLQTGLRPAFAARLVLAATLAANYGLYGPAFELMENAPRESGGEEYRDSEKYQLRQWRVDRPDSLWPLIARINRIRRDNSALQSDRYLRFCSVDNDQLLAYRKHDPSRGNIVLVVVNLDPHNSQSGWVDFELADFGIGVEQTYQVHDLLSDQRYQWRGPRNYVLLDPQQMPAHVFLLRRHVRTEQDFDYFL